MSVRFPEEVKEAVYRLTRLGLTKKVAGKAILIRVSPKGEWEFIPKLFNVKEEKDKLTLTEFKPLEKPPSREKQRLVDEIASAIRENLQQQVEAEVKKALLEKPVEELLILKEKAKEARLKRKRGCFFLETDDISFLL